MIHGDQIMITYMVTFWGQDCDKATLKCFAVYSAHPPGFLAYSDKKYKKYKIFYEYAYGNLCVLKHKIKQYKYF